MKIFLGAIAALVMGVGALGAIAAAFGQESLSEAAVCVGLVVLAGILWMLVDISDQLGGLTSTEKAAPPPTQEIGPPKKGMKWPAMVTIVIVVALCCAIAILAHHP
jgi:hypothetical protein